MQRACYDCDGPAGLRKRQINSRAYTKDFPIEQDELPFLCVYQTEGRGRPFLLFCAVVAIFVIFAVLWENTMVSAHGAAIRKKIHREFIVMGLQIYPDIVK